MRVFVAGGSGAVGRSLVRQLVGRGHEVVATTATPKKLDELRALGAEAVLMDGLDAQSVGEAVAQARPEVLVHEMTAIPTPPDFKHFDATFAVTNRLRTEGTRHLLAAAQAVGARRFVAQSYTGWPNARQGGPVKTEDDPLDTNPPAIMRSTLEAIRELERMVTGAPLQGVVLRYGNLYGPGASDPLIPLMQRRRMPVVGSGAGVWSWIHVDDAAGATVAAVEGSATGVFNIVDDEPATVATWLPYLAQTLHAPAPHTVPAWLARLIVGEPGVSMMTQVRGSSNAKAKRELGWQPRWATWREGFRHALLPASETAATVA